MHESIILYKNEDRVDESSVITRSIVVNTDQRLAVKPPLS